MHFPKQIGSYFTENDNSFWHNIGNTVMSLHVMLQRSVYNLQNIFIYILIGFNTIKGISNPQPKDNVLNIHAYESTTLFGHCNAHKITKIITKDVSTNFNRPLGNENRANKYETS